VKEYDPNRVEKRINDFWVRTYAYTRDKNFRAKQKKYYFVDGPPFTAGSITLGLARNKILKDAHVRFVKSQGFDVLDKPGFDMHGLPIEVKVEESLGLKYKNQIEELGVEKFVRTCMEFADAHRNTMTEQFRSLGIWLDWQNPYLTADSKYIESVWWSLKESYKKKFLERQKQVTGWCPRCESPLAPGEISYKPTEGHSVYFKIPIKGKRDEYIIVWTTTPWTFAGCLAIAVNPDLTYARVAIRQGGKKSTIIVLENRVEEIASTSNIEAYEIIDTVQGKSLQNLGFFHPLMADIQFHKSAEGKWCHKIIALDSVHDSHTGCVYISPGLGIADANIAEKYSLPVFSPVDERGVFTTEVGMKYAGQNTEEASASILADMKSLRFVLSSSKQEHNFGHCWRCDSPVINRITEQWFLKSEGIMDVMLKILKGASWTPDTFGIKRQHDWISKCHDWCISRQRFWGTPLPIWECIVDICGHVEIVGSVRELEGANGYYEGMDLHRPWIDAVNLECPKCGGLMKRVPDIIDVWFDSSAASWAQLGYPRKKALFKEMWPADWIAESQDQSKGWFYNQIFAGAVLFGKIPFRRVLAHGHIIGDGPAGISDISTATELYGTDALRLFILSLDPTENAIFKTADIKESHSVLKILWNCYAFSASYMNMDGWAPKENQFAKVKAALRQEDIWLISRAESLTHAVKKEMDAMRTHLACKLIEDFIVEDLSRWYIRLSRERMWEESLTPDKEAAFTVQREILTRLSLIMSPLTPYMAEMIYQEMDGKMLSVSMVPWPETDASRLAEGMERSMTMVRDIVRTSQKFRQELGLGLRWPIGKMTISAKDQANADAVRTFPDIIKSQTNVKELELVPENQEWAGQELIVVPNRNVIGKAYKQRLSKIARMLKVLSAKEIKEKVEAGEYELGIEGEMIKILPDMVRFETKLPEGIESKEFNGGTLYFDTKMTDELMAEGFAREIIRRIQQMRKEAGLDPEEYINLRIKMDDALLDLLDKWLERIADTTRATQMEVVDDVSEEDYIIEWPIEEETVVIGITSLNIRKAMSEFLGQRDIDNELALAIVEAGILNSMDFLLADRDEVLKIPGMNHSKYRKLKEYLELPEEKRKLEDSMCPLCNGYVEQGSTSCQRCGKDLISGEELAVEIIRDIEAEEEPEYLQEPVRERVKIEKKKKTEPEVPPEPEDEIVKMASDRGDGARAEDEIASEIMSGISDDEQARVSRRTDQERAQPEPIAEPQPAPLRPTEKQPEEEIEEDRLLEQIISDRRDTPPRRTRETEYIPTKSEPVAEQPMQFQAAEKRSEEEPDQDRLFEALLSWKGREPEAKQPEPEAKRPSQRPGAEPPIPIPTAESPGESPTQEGRQPVGKAGTHEPDESDIEETFQRELEIPAGLEIADKSEIIDQEKDIAIDHIADTFDIKNSAAKTLYNHGYTTVESFSTVSEDELREIKGIGKITARRIVQKASKEETKMCSLCNAIVPMSSKVCTRCGVKFVSGAQMEAESAEEQLAALEMLDEKLSAKPSDSALLYSKAQTLRDAGRYEEALEVTNQALSTSPKDSKLKELRNELEDEIEEQEEAIPRRESVSKRETGQAAEEARKPGEAMGRQEGRADLSAKEAHETPDTAMREEVRKEYPRAKSTIIPGQEPTIRARKLAEDEFQISPDELEAEEPLPDVVPEAKETEPPEPDEAPSVQKSEVSVHVHMHDLPTREAHEQRPGEEPHIVPGRTITDSERQERKKDIIPAGKREYDEAKPEPGKYPAGPRAVYREDEPEKVRPATVPHTKTGGQAPEEISQQARYYDAKPEPKEAPRIAKPHVTEEEPVWEEAAPRAKREAAPREPEPEEAPLKAKPGTAAIEAEPEKAPRVRPQAVALKPELEERPSVAKQQVIGDEEPEEIQPQTRPHAATTMEEPEEPVPQAKPLIAEEKGPRASEDEAKEPRVQTKEIYIPGQQVTHIQQERSVEVIKETRYVEPHPPRQQVAYQPRQPEPPQARTAEAVRETRYVESTPVPIQVREETKEPKHADVLQMPPSTHEMKTEAIVLVNEQLPTIHETPKETQALQDAANASDSVPEGAEAELEEIVPEEMQLGEVPTPEEGAPGELETEEIVPEEMQPEDAISEEITPEELPHEETIEEPAQQDLPSSEETARPEATTLKDMVSEMIPTKEEEDLEGAYQNGDIKLKSSFTYLIPEERSARSYQLFRKAIGEGMPGYCVTRTFPEKIRERYELGNIPILWLSNVAKEEAVRPKDLEKLSLSLEEFLSEEGGIILLDGIEYLITNNNFITVLKLIQSLRDQVAINRSILLLSINPSTMDSHQINLLKREVDSVIE